MKLQLPGYFSTSSSFFSRESPLKLCAMIFPCGSTKTLKGIPEKLNVATAALFHSCRSLTCVQASLSLSTAPIQSPLSLSRDTPSIVNFLSLYFLYACTTFGFSFLQGRHQLAQKSTNTNFPLNELRVIVLPFASGKESSGACLS